ncbi:hypothetical protein ACHAXM_004912, partial [Skeletonema potamos]
HADQNLTSRSTLCFREQSKTSSQCPCSNINISSPCSMEYIPTRHLGVHHTACDEDDNCATFCSSSFY